MRRPAKRDGKTKIEQDMNALLALRSDVELWHFEAIKLRLADRTWYTPDFWIEYNDGTIEVREVKGPFAREDSIVKFKLALELYPEFFWSYWRQRRDGEWELKYGEPYRPLYPRPQDP